MNITNKRSFIHKARKSQNYKYDDDEKQMLINVLWKHFKIASVRAAPIMQDDKILMVPDVVTTNHSPKIYFELNGLGHGWDEFPSSRTWEKRHLYETLELNCHEIWSDEKGKYNPKLIIERLKVLGLQRIY